DLIDEGQQAIHDLAGELKLTLTRILRAGFGYIRRDEKGRPQIGYRTVSRGWDRMGKELGSVSGPYRLAEKRWDTPIAVDIARRSAANWLDEQRADEELRATVTGLRGFFLADPEELSLIALVDAFSEDADNWPDAMYRIDGGNDRLAAA